MLMFVGSYIYIYIYIYIYVSLTNINVRNNNEFFIIHCKIANRE